MTLTDLKKEEVGGGGDGGIQVVPCVVARYDVLALLIMGVS